MNNSEKILNSNQLVALLRDACKQSSQNKVDNVPEFLANYLIDKGAIVIPPEIKIGTIVWSSEPFKDGIPREGSVVAITISSSGVSEIIVNFDPEPLTAYFSLFDMGKTVFFSYDEAETKGRLSQQK